MSIEALMLGRLHARPEERTSKTGHPFVTCKVRVPVAEGETVFANCVAFADLARAALLALDAGDAVALAGAIKPGAWVDKEGAARPSLDMVAQRVMTTYELKRKRDAAAGPSATLPRPSKPAPTTDEFHDGGDEWLNGGKP